MAKILVEIEIPNRTAEEIRSEPDWLDSEGRIMIDEAYLNRSEEDDCFFEFAKFEVKDE